MGDRNRGKSRNNRRRSNNRSGGAYYCQTVHGTEVDSINCPFYYKMGCCRHGIKCSRQHNYPVTSSTILFPHLWIDEGVEGLSLNDFYNDVYTTCEEECGKIRSLQILDNNIPYLQGNVFVSFENEQSAIKCQNLMHGRFYNGRIIVLYHPLSFIPRRGPAKRC